MKERETEKTKENNKKVNEKRKKYIIFVLIRNKNYRRYKNKYMKK